MDEIKYIIKDISERGKHYPYHSKNSSTSFTWSYDLVHLYDSKEEAEKHAKYIMNTPPNEKRILVVRDNKKIVRKEKLRKIDGKTKDI